VDCEVLHVADVAAVVRSGIRDDVADDCPLPLRDEERGLSSSRSKASYGHGSEKHARSLDPYHGEQVGALDWPDGRIDGGHGPDCAREE